MSGFALIKATVVLIILAAFAGMISLWYEVVFVGNYLASAGLFLTIITVASPAVAFAAVTYAVRFIAKLKQSDINL